LFFDELDRCVLENMNYVRIDASKLKSITAAASLILFAKVTRCQCCAPQGVFRYRDQVILIDFGENEEMERFFVKVGLWAALKSGGQSKLDKLWNNNDVRFKSGSNPSREFSEIISWLRTYKDPLPKKMMSALQEAYLNIAHHAYERFKKKDIPLVPFMYDRWWQYASYDSSQGGFSVVLYDMGVGMPEMVREQKKRVKDSRAVEIAMETGFTTTKVVGRGRGSEDMQRPIKVNDYAEYLFVYSGRGLVVYDHDGVIQSSNLRYGISGTLIEWRFNEEVDDYQGD